MRLVYTATTVLHKEGDVVQTGDLVYVSDQEVTVMYFAEPHKSSSQGKVTVRTIEDDLGDGFDREYYVGVIGAKWIDRGNF